MKKGILLVSAAILSLGVAGEATAATPDAGFCNDEQTCLWKIDSAGTLTIYAKENETEVEIKDYYCEGVPYCNGNRPWESNIYNIENIIIGDNIVSIGRDAFQNATNLKTVTGMKDVQTIGIDSFYGARSLNYVMLADGVSVSVPPNSPSFGMSGVPNCGKLGGTCENCGDKYVKSGVGCVTAENCGAGYVADEASKKCLCAKNKVTYKGQCLDEYPFAKKHYTPAEAAQWLNEDNNTITLTFKKQ